MQDFWTRRSVLLGAERAIVVYDVANQCISARIRLKAPYYSSYSSSKSAVADISVARDGNAVAVGTAGGVYIVTNREDLEFGNLDEIHQICERRSVLATCFVDRSSVAFSTASGRCSWMERKRSPRPNRLLTEGGPICSMLRLDGNTFVGLSSAGKLVFWMLPAQGPYHTVAVPPPPALTAAVRMVYWPAARALAWPGMDGYLVLYYLDNGQVQRIQAHRGDFYAVTSSGRFLVTVGATDARVKRWRALEPAPVAELIAPAGTVSAAVLDKAAEKIVLVDRGGSAVFYGCRSKRLSTMAVIPGRGYRLVRGPIETELRALRELEEAAAPHHFVHAESAPTNPAVAELPEPPRELSLPPLKMPLALPPPATPSEGNGDIVTRIQSYAKLTQQLPDHLEPAIELLGQYAVLLERVWQLREAERTYERILGLDSKHVAAKRIKHLQRCQRVLREDDCVVTIDVPIEDVVAAAGSNGAKCVSPLAFRHQDPIRCRGVSLTAEEIAKKYREVCRERPENAWPHATVRHVRWLSLNEMERVDVVTFQAGTKGPVKGLELALKVVGAALDTVVVPTLLFDIERATQGIPSARQAKVALKAVRDLESDARSGGWLAALASVITHTLRRLVTKGMADRDEWPG